MPQNTHSKKASGPVAPQNEGEGSRSGARQYDAAAEKAAQDPEHVKKAAQEAKDALDGPEGKDLRKAEERGKHHKH